MQKNPIEQLDQLISHGKWIEARKLLVSLSPLQAVHAVLTAIHQHECIADEVDWNAFNQHLMGAYPPANIPEWCQMPEDEHHQCVGGCWGILHGEVVKKGKEHCLSCEYKADDEPA